MEQFVTRVLRIQIVLATPVLVLFIFDARALFSFLLGAKWAAAGDYAAILSWVGYVSFLTAWLDRLFDVKGRQKLSLLMAAAGSASTLAGLSLALWLTRNTVLAVGVFAALQVLYISIWLCVAYRVADFRMGTLLLLAKDVVITAGIAGAVIGLIHLVLRPGWAVPLSIASVALMDMFFFFRYVAGGHAFGSTSERFRHFWNTKLARGGKGNRYLAQVDELKALISACNPARILEIGCGQGSLFSRLGFPVTGYKGVDFCEQRLSVFRSKYPEARLECADGSSYVEPNASYDLVLMNGVVQHFDEAMLRSQLRNARLMTHGSSAVVWTSVPDRDRRKRYDTGESFGAAPSRIRWFKYRLSRALGLDLMGYWYTKEEIARLAAGEGLVCEFVDSGVFPYRFHAIMKRPVDLSPEKRSQQKTVRIAQEVTSG
jgi:SAM-dependent methyltransferase